MYLLSLLPLFVYICEQVSKDSNFVGNEHGKVYLDAESGNETLSYSDRNETSENKTKRFRVVRGRSILGRSLACS